MLGEKDLIFFAAILLQANGFSRYGAIEEAQKMYDEIFTSEDKEGMILE